MAPIVSSLLRYLFRIWNPPFHQPVSFLVESLHLTRAYYAAAELGIADLLANQPREVGELAQLTNADRRSLHRVLRTLAAFGVFAEDRQQRFHMTRRARVLLSEGPESLRSWLILMGSPEVWQGYSCTLQSVRTGVPAFRLAHGADFYEYLAAHPKLGTTFADAMSRWTEWQCREIASTFDFRSFRSIIDVGGGAGSLLEQVLVKNMNLRGTLFDQPETILNAHARFARAELSNRCELVGGDFLQHVPGKSGICVLKHVLRDWPDDQAVSILRNCHAALEPGGTLLVVEGPVDPRNRTDRMIKLIDLELASLLSGGLRTYGELNSLLDDSGFSPVKVHTTLVPDSQIIEARKT